MPIQKRYFIPMAVVLMGSFSFHTWKSELSPDIKREIASGVSIDAENEDSNLPRQELERLSQLAVDIDQAKQEILELENEKRYIQDMLDKEDLNDDDLKELGTALSEAENDLSANADSLKELEQNHTREMDSLIQVYENQKKEIEQLAADNTDESEIELDKKMAELESLKEAMDKLKKDLDGSQTDNESLDTELQQARAEIEVFQEKEEDLKAAYCQQQDKVSDLETQISELLKDKEEVAEKVVEIAEDKDGLNSKIDQLREDVSPKEKEEDKEEALASQDFDVTAIMNALTNLSQQLEFNSQMLAMQRFQMPGPSSSFQGLSPGTQAMNQYYGFNTSAFQSPANTGYSFAPGQGFQMVRPYGSSLMGQEQSMPNFDFGGVPEGLQSRYPAAPRSQAGSVFFDFNSPE